MKQVSRVLVPVLVATALIIIVVIAVVNQPLSKSFSITPSIPTREITTPQAPITEQFVPTQAVLESETTHQLSNQPVEPTPTISQALTNRCNVRGSTSILVLGESNPELNEKRGADAIRLVKVDYDQKKVTVLAVPSNLVIRVIGNDTITLTLVYYESKLTAEGDERSRMREATNALAQVLTDRFNYTPQHYVVINQHVFLEAVNTLGGIEVTVPNDVDGTADNKGYFTAGEHIFDGKMALDYVKVLNDKAKETKLEIGRFQRQNDVLKAILIKAQKPENWIKGPQLVNQFIGNVVTDLSIKQLLDINCLYNDPSFRVDYIEIPPDVVVRSPDLPLLPIDPKLANFITGSLE